MSPVCHRELLVAARRGSTYWTRCLAVLLVLAPYGWLILSRPAATPGRGLGGLLFGQVTVLVFGWALFSTLFAAADSLGRERREGTLGLLFLTHLRSADIVLGKLAACGVDALFRLLALLPVLAGAMLLGGVSGGEFVRMSLVLAVTLLTSICLGLFAATQCRERDQSFALSLLLILVVTFAGWSIAALGSLWPSLAVLWSGIRSCSLFTAYQQAFDTPYHQPWGGWFYWQSLLAGLGLAGGALWLAIRRLPHAWAAEASPVAPQNTPVSPGHPRAVSRTRPGDDPVCWLALRRHPRTHWMSLFMGSALLYWGLLCCGLLWAMGRAGTGRAPLFVSSLLAPLIGVGVVVFHGTLKAMVARQASSFLVEDRQSGLLEALFGSSLSTREIMGGRMRALRLLVWQPTAALLGIELVFTLLAGMSFGATIILFMLMVGLVLVMDLYALAWTGFWLGLKTGDPRRSLNGTCVRILVIPWLVLAMGGLTASVRNWSDFAWLYLGISGFVNMVVGGLAHANCHFWLRHLATNPNRSFADIRRETPEEDTGAPLDHPGTGSRPKA